MKEFELEQDEHVVIEVRKHWLLFVVTLLPYAILAVIPLAIPNVLRTAPPLQPFANSFDYSMPILRLVLAGWWLVIWSTAFNSFTRYFLNAWIITNQRVVEITQYGLFRREVSSLFLNRIEDVTTDTNGVVASLLDIGNINAQTAGAEERFTMHGVPHPAMLRDIMLKYESLHEDAKMGK